MTQAVWRLPAEWEPQDGILLAWPHAETDWAPNLAAVERCYVELIGAILRYEPVVLCVANAKMQADAQARLIEGGARIERLHFAKVEYDDTWLRDSGPVTLSGPDGFRLLDFH